MRQGSNPSRRLVLITLVVIGSCGAGRASAEDFGPAQVILLTNATADRLLKFDPPPPPDGRVLVAGDDQGTVFAFVLGSDTDDANEQLGKLRADVIAGCIPEGVTCCDQSTHMWALDSEFENERFWLRLGQGCPPVEEGAEPGVPFEKVDIEIWQGLTELGVTHPLMTFADLNYERRVLVAPWFEASELPLPRHLGLRTLSPIILVKHVNPNSQPPGPAAPSGGCVTKTGCDRYDSSRCYADSHAGGTRHTERHHWYVKDELTGKWCESTEKCNCP
jgi:hypothetical protein